MQKETYNVLWGHGHLMSTQGSVQPLEASVSVVVLERISPSMANTNKQGCDHQSSSNKDKRWVSTYGLFSLAFLFVFAATNFIVNWVDLTTLFLCSTILPSESFCLESLISSIISHSPLPPLSPPHCNSWFRHFSSVSDSLWLHAFRMSKPSFSHLFHLLSPSLANCFGEDRFGFAKRAFNCVHGNVIGLVGDVFRRLRSRITSTTILKTIIVFNNQQPQFPLNCTNGKSASTCPSYYPTKLEFDDDSSNTSCPEYFRWIHEDLKPWESTGITRDMVERGKHISHFRLVIVNGKAYIEKFAKSYQTRDVFTIWGILQLLRLYPGKIPDLELMFQCGDRTVVFKKDFQVPKMSPPPVFHYCGEENSYDIVFPDWTFWGWAELSIRPWETTLHNILEGNKLVKWKDRIPYAFWKGNPTVSIIRRELGKCNTTEKHDWNARIYDIIFIIPPVVPILVDPEFEELRWVLCCSCCSFLRFLEAN
ncbi:hypothetical protein JHK85_018244 [Glycine max]|nr:hypothetical protein JHK85_018244 [Glycine max]